MSTLTPGQLREFDDKGFVIVDEVFSRSELNVFHKVAQQVIRNFMTRAENAAPGVFADVAPGEECGKGLVRLAATNRRFFDEVYDTLWQTPAFMRMVSKRKTEAMVNRLMNRATRAPLYGFINRCRITLPNDEKSHLGWHQEIFQTIPNADFIQIWAPLIFDASRLNGALEMGVGSHRAELPKPNWRENQRGVSKVEFDESVAGMFELQTMELRLGQAVFFPGRLLHRSGKNESELPRYVMVGLYHKVDDADFDPPKMQYTYRGRVPKDWFESLAARY